MGTSNGDFEKMGGELSQAFGPVEPLCNTICQESFTQNYKVEGMSIWKLSASAEKDVQLLRNLLQKPPLLGSKRKICTLIERLLATCELAAIPSVASGLFSPDEVIHNAASAGIAKRMDLVPSIELMRLNELLGGCNDISDCLD